MATVAIRGHNYIKSDTSEVVCFVLVKRKMECFNKNKNKVPNATVKIHDNTESGVCVCLYVCVDSMFGAGRFGGDKSSRICAPTD